MMSVRFNRAPCVALVLLLAGIGVNCTPRITSPSDGPCDNQDKAYAHQIIRNDPNDFYTLKTPDAKNDCEAHYRFFFRWADVLRRASEERGHESMPPLQNMAQGFQPYGEASAYFPHDNPKYDPTAMPPDDGYSSGWWVIDFSVGNKNTGHPHTNYYVRARLDPGVAIASDSTEIYCAIYYKPISE